MTELPADVLMRLGPSPQDLTRRGLVPCPAGQRPGRQGRFPRGDAREAFLFGEAAALLPVDVPDARRVRAGLDTDGRHGFGEPAAPDDVTPLEELAPTHELFVGATGIEHDGSATCSAGSVTSS